MGLPNLVGFTLRGMRMERDGSRRGQVEAKAARHCGAAGQKLTQGRMEEDNKWVGLQGIEGAA